MDTYYQQLLENVILIKSISKCDLLLSFSRKTVLLISFSMTLCVNLICSSLYAQVSVVTQHNSNSRIGANFKETILNTTNVDTATFGKIGTLLVDDQIYAQPLVVSNVSIPNRGTHNVVYIATVNNSVYAYDADQIGNPVLYWKVNFTPSNGMPVKNTDMTLACNSNYQDFSGNMGIVGTPVIDTITGTMYFVARTKENGSTYVQRLHAIDIKDGSYRPGSPVVISANIPGTGAGSVNGVINFNPYIQNQRSALLLLNGVVYIAWASHCDFGPYHGWILGYNASTLQQVTKYITTPTGVMGGIWMSGQGPAADENGNIYVSTGNGTVGDVNNPTGSTNRAESFIKLIPSNGVLNVATWFTPYNYQFLNDNDLDLGSSGPILIPNTNLTVGGGKSGIVYVLNRDNMGGLSTSGNDNQIIQSFSVINSGIRHLHGSTVYWSGSTGEYIYVMVESDYLKAYRFNRSTGKFDLPYSSISNVRVPSGMPGGILSVSSNGTVDGTGIIWVTHPFDGDANHRTAAGILRAFDARDVSKELWNSMQFSARDDVGSFAKFSPPTIVNGKVYCPSFSNKLDIYGLLSTNPIVFRTPENPTSVTQGLEYSYYQGTYSILPDFSKLTPVATGITANFTITNRLRNDSFAFQFKGYIDIPTQGYYTFFTNSDDGSRLFIGDELVVDNDRRHTTYERSGSIALKAGRHLIRVGYFDYTMSENLAVSYQGPNIPKQAIPSSVLYRLNSLGLREPDNPSNAVNGLDYSYYQGQYTSIPNLASLTPVKTGIVTNVDLSPRNQNDYFVFQYKGYVNVPTDGVYTFYTNSDDGSKLYIGNQLIVDNDGLHGARERSGSIGLKAGMHAITVQFLEYTGNQVLTVSYSGGSLVKQAIPSGQLYRTSTVTLRNPDNPSNTVSGLNYAYYEGNYTSLPNTELLQPVKSGNITSFDLTPRNRNDYFVFKYTGYVSIPADGMYTFYTNSDDGSNLYIGNQQVVNNDGLHGTVERSGTIGLKAGLHAITVNYFEYTGNQILSVSYSGPTIGKQVVPSASLFRQVSAIANARIVSGGANEDSVSLSPIPVEDQLTIQSHCEMEEVRIIISDPHANVYLDDRFNVENKKLSLPLGYLKNGVYVVTILYKDQKIVKTILVAK